MADEGHTEALARTLTRGVSELRSGRPDVAEPLLAEVCADSALAEADDLRDVRARALSLWADALLRLGRAERASAPIDEAMHLLRQLGDGAGLDEVRSLRTRLLQAREAEAAQERHRRSAANLRELSLEALRDRFGDRPLALADALIKKANAEAEAGDAQVGLVAVREALQLAQAADSLREWVFARVSLARLEPDQAPEHLEAAWSRAERAGEFNLVSAVARAAEAQGVALPVQVGPDLSRASGDSLADDNDPNSTMG